MTITRITSVVALVAGLGSPAAAQVPLPAPPASAARPARPAPPQPPARPAPPAPAPPPSPWFVDVSDLSQITLPDLSNITLPDLSNIELPDLSSLPMPALPPFDLPLQAWQEPVTWVGPVPGAAARQAQYEGLYDQARNLIEQNQYDRAIQSLDRIITAGTAQAPGAMYWKAYSLARIARRPDALTTLSELRGKFPKSPWVKDAQALEVEVKQASGQSVSAEAQGDDELKLLALRGLMQTDPETALPVIEKMLGGSSSVRVKDRALFVVSQSRSPRGRAVIVGVAKGNGNPDLQLRAIRYIGQMAGADAASTLDEVYRATSEERVKREIIRALGNARAKDRLLALARSETSAELRGDAVRALGNMSAAAELEQLYRSESSPDVKKRILQAMQNGNAADRLAGIARAETDPELKRSAIQYIGNVRGAAATETLTSLYAAEPSAEIKVAIISALASHNSAAALVTLARAEKNAELKAQIVRRLSNMRSAEARDYMLELLK